MKDITKLSFKLELLLILLNVYTTLSTNIYPIYNFIITSNLNHINITNDNIYDYLFFSLNTKGIGIIFDYNSEINLIPYNIIKQIKDLLRICVLDSYSFLVNKENNYEELIFYGYIADIITFHFITEKIGITIPNDIIFNKTTEYSGKSSFIFLTKQNQENIIFGKYLIDLMKIEFNSNKEFVINNKEFISQVNDG